MGLKAAGPPSGRHGEFGRARACRDGTVQSRGRSIERDIAEFYSGRDGSASRFRDLDS
jgi:hypothetical protein